MHQDSQTSPIPFKSCFRIASKRLNSRIMSAKFVGIAYISDKKVAFNKYSQDGSGKANLCDCPRSVTWGTLYEVDTTDLKNLDRAEGGYKRTAIQVTRPDGQATDALSYISTRVITKSVACHWYKELIISGAREHGVPNEYIVKIGSLSTNTAV